MNLKHAILATLVALALVPSAASASRPVTLRDARVSPSYLRLLEPGRATTVLRQCPGYFWQELSAYQWNGESLPAQRWNRDHTLLRWGRVTFDGITFRNHYRQPVLVAGWC